MSKNGGFDGLTITFKSHDGRSKHVMRTNPQFFENDRGRRLSVNKIIENINTLKHDLGAKSYTLHS